MATETTSGVQKGISRVLGTVDFFSVSVATVISGMYFGWNYGLGFAGPVGFLLAIVFSFIFYWSILINFSELGTAIPKAGGTYLFAERAIGGMAGTIAAVFIFLASITGLSSVAMGFASYLNAISGFLNVPSIAIISIIVTMILAILNVKFSSKIQLAITLITIVVLALFFVICGSNNQGISMYRPAYTGGFMGFLMAIPFGMWLFIGCENAIGLAEEVKEPGKTIPRGFLYSIMVLLAISLLLWWSSVGVISWQELGKSDAPIIEAIYSYSSPSVLFMINVASVASLFGTLLGLMLYSTRVLLSVSRDGYLPHILSAIHPRFSSPYVSVIVVGIISIGLCFFSGLERTVAAASGSAVGVYVLLALSVIFLRKREPDLKRPYKIKGWLYPLVPVLTIVMALIVFSSYFFSDRATFYVFIAAAAIGAVYYLAVGKRNIKKDNRNLQNES